jgi:hypothetical protein
MTISGEISQKVRRKRERESRKVKANYVAFIEDGKEPKEFVNQKKPVDVIIESDNS